MQHEIEPRTELARSWLTAASRKRQNCHSLGSEAAMRPAVRTFPWARSAFACLIAGTLALGGAPAENAYAVTSDELRAEADAIMQRIDTLQTDLNQANADYETAISERDAAETAMDDAQQRIADSEERIGELQGHLSVRARDMYKNGNTTFVDVLLGSSSFTEFLTAWDSFDRIAAQNASMVEETEQAKAEAEQARQDYESERNRAQEEIDRAAQLAAEIEATQASLQEQVDQITAEAAELQAQEEAAAEAARQAQEAAEAAERQAQQQAQAASSASSGSSGSYSSGATDSVSVSSGGQFANPCPGGTLSSNFGYRDFDASFHKGIDLAAAEGTPFYAAEAGTVIIAGYSSSAGNWIVISHGNGLITKYMHASAIYVSAGQQVSKGQHIGAVGNTGNSFGAHLHFQVEVGASSWSGTAVNPYNYL